ncbi:hypothetical protein [Pseudomonas putida]|uniref:hypothetical protein n=1 Tax=Pseudomonas putida TaxID=303 RepID=UPI0039E0DDEE
MNTLLNRIRQHTTGPLGTTLVIGAGNGSALANWRELGSTRLVMAEAHPRQAEELARRLRSDLGEELLAVAITPADQQTAALHALNNPAYSSLQPPRGLLDCYPNLRIEAPMQTPATSLASLLAQQALNADGDHLLLLSASGQAFELLNSAPHDLLQAFRWLLVNTSSEPLYENEREPAALTALLREAGFDLAAEDPDALYPQASLLFERNNNAVRTLRVEREVATLRNRLTATTQQAAKREAELQKQLSEQSAALAAQTRLATEHQAQLDQLTKEKAELTAARDALAEDKTALAQARDEQTKLATERQAQLDQLTQEKAELTAARDALAKDKTALTQARDEQAKLATDRQAQLDQLTKEKAELTAARDTLAKDKTALTQARDEQAKLATDRQAQLDQLTKEKAELTAARDTLAKDKTALTQARDEQSQLATERKAQLDQLTKEKAELTAARDTLAKDKTVLTQARDEQAKLATERQAQLDQLTKEKAELTAARDTLAKDKTALTQARDEQSQLATERKAQLDKITTERDQLQKSLNENKKALEGAKQQIQQLEEEASESLHRQQLLHEELIKAEAQIELIKDLLLREPGL